MPQRDNYQSGDARDNYRDNDNYRDERSYERPYRGRGYQASPGRGGPRGRGPRPSRPPRSNQNYNQDNRHGISSDLYVQYILNLCSIFISIFDILLRSILY